MFTPWQLAAIDAAGYNGIRDEHIERVAQKIIDLEIREVDFDTLESVCESLSIDVNNFDDDAIEPSTHKPERMSAPESWTKTERIQV